MNKPRIHASSAPGRWLRHAVATFALAAAGGVGVAALAAPQGSGDRPHGRMMQAGGHHGGDGTYGSHGGPGSMAMAGPGMARLLERIGATDEQRAQIEQITQAASSEMQGRREAGRALHEQWTALFAQPTVDATAAEALRQQMLAQHDQASQRRLQTMLEISRVLTPDQRAQMAELQAERRAAMAARMAERGQAHGGKGMGQPRGERRAP